MESMPGNSRFRISEGDWICSDPQCGNVNFARRDTCNRCDKEKGDFPKKKKLGQEIGKAAAEKSRGLFSADDWQCNKCGNVNWARRQSCNMCNAPKYGEVEERTGYGGGYNDRGKVEYITRQESDDEYDEFGRRKKKKNNVTEEKSKTQIPIQREEEDEEEEEEEEEDEEDEEDDDDGDLSKYDLSGWGEDDIKSDVNQKEKDREGRKQNKQSRSRSRSRTRSCSRSRSSRSKSHSPILKRSRNHLDSRPHSRSSHSSSGKSSSRSRFGSHSPSSSSSSSKHNRQHHSRSRSSNSGRQ